MDYRDVPTAVFSQPNLGTVGLTEAEARERLPAIDVYRSTFRPLKHTLSGRDEQTMMKLVVDRATDRVVGCHMIGADAGEIIQGLAVALRCNATKAQFDATVGIRSDRGRGVRDDAREGGRSRLRLEEGNPHASGRRSARSVVIGPYSGRSQPTATATMKWLAASSTQMFRGPRDRLAAGGRSTGCDRSVRRADATCLNRLYALVVTGAVEDSGRRSAQGWQSVGRA